MNSNFLPWPLYVLVMFGIGIGIYFIVFVEKSKKDYPIVLRIGMVIICIGLIISGIEKVVENIVFFKKNLFTLEKLAMLSSVGIPLILIGCYQKVKDDPERKRAMLILYGSSLCIAMPLILIMHLL